MIYCRVPANQWVSSGVAFAIRKDWKHKIQDYTWISDRIIETRIKVLNRNFTIAGVQPPVEGKEEDTEEFYRELQQSMDKIPENAITILAGDFNGRIGNQPNPECIGTYGQQVTNRNEAVLRDFCAFNKLKITNSLYRHKDIHKFMCEPRGTKSIIDYIIINDRLKSNIEDTRVFRGSEIDSDHKLMESKFKFLTHAKHSYKKKDKTIYTKPPAFKVHLLEQESIRTLYRNGLKGKPTPLTGKIDTDWLKIKEAVTKAAEESMGYKKWKNRKWFRTWNEEIQQAIEKKKASYRKYLQNKTVEDYIELFQNNYQQDDTYGLSFISGLVVLHSTCFELKGAHHQEFTFFTVQAASGILCTVTCNVYL